MKKFFAILLAAAMMATLALPTLAATELTTSPASGKGKGDYNIGVNGSFTAGATAEEKISVDILWDSMNFTYTAGGKVYDPATHKTTETDGIWSKNRPGITVKNHSNVAIDAIFIFTAATGVTTKGIFYESAEATSSLNTDAQKLFLESAEGKVRDDNDGSRDETPKGTLYFGVVGDGITADQKLGTITVKIAKGVKAVTSEAALKAALEEVKTTGGTVKLGEEIVLTDLLTLSGYGTSTNPVVLDLGGHNMHGHIEVNENSNVTVCNGAVWYTSPESVQHDTDVATLMAFGSSKLTVKNIIVHATNAVALSVADSEATVDNCTFNGSYAMTSEMVVTVTNYNSDLTTDGSSTLTFKNDVTVKSRISNSNAGGKASIIMAAGGSYMINSNLKEPGTDYTVLSTDSDIVIWSN